MTKREASEYLGVSVRAINRYISSKKLKVSYRKTEANSLIAVLNDAEVQALKEAPPSLTALATRSEGQLVKRGEAGELRDLLSDVVSQLRINSKLTLTLDEAVKVSGVSRKVVRDAILNGELKARRGLSRGWNIKRTDLDLWVKKL